MTMHAGGNILMHTEAYKRR